MAIGVSFEFSGRGGDDERELPVLGSVPAFSFTDQDGGEFSSTELEETVWVADFFFTRCSAACPRMTARMLELQRRIAADDALAGRVHLVSFSVDPGNDDPKALGEFARNYGADTASWTFLTGEAGEVTELSRNGFLLAASDAPAGAPAAVPAEEGVVPPEPTHSDRFCLVDRLGRLRGHYRPAETPGELDRLLGDLRRLVDDEEPPRP